MIRTFTVVFEHVEYDQKLTVDPVWAEHAEDTINKAKAYLSYVSEWDVHSISRKED